MPLNTHALGFLSASNTSGHLVRLPLPPLAEVVPHRRSMLFLDEITAWDGQRVECRVVPRDDSAFVEGGRVPATLAIEYMAQCVAVYGGLIAWARGEPMRIGYLVGAPEVVLEVDDFRVGEGLRVEASNVWGGDTLGSFACAVSRGGTVVARGVLNVYRGDLQPGDPA